MNPAVNRMLSRYDHRSLQEKALALREVMQEIALVGLWRSKFFEHAAFYGGTALRIFYGLDRFSEDLDFTLYAANSNFTWQPYEKAVVEEMASFGFQVEIQEKEKSIDTPIKSAFLKANTVRELLQIGIKTDALKGVNKEAKIRIKVEVDTDPPVLFAREQKYLRDPIPVPIACVTESQLFAAKLHAAFYRTWKNRVKGRDWYDVVWFIRKGVPLDLALFSKLNGTLFDEAAMKQLIDERLLQLDIKAAKQDILPFLKDAREVEMWSEPFFRHWFSELIFSHSNDGRE